ncbi:MAG: hypothetical protein ACKVU4_15810 [Phycisphaerales bacterium]
MIRDLVTAAATVLAACAAAAGQSYSAGFESPPFAGSAGGSSLTFQDGWYNPVTGSADCRVFTYAGNAYGFAPNPGGAGGGQFAAGRSAGGSAPARAQRDAPFTGGDWTVSWDMAVRYDGVLPSAPNLGSFSLQPLPGARSWQTLFNWFNITTAASWQCSFVVYNAAGLEISPPIGVLPSAAWGGLSPNTWYRVSASWSFATNRITSLSITNLATGATTTDTPADWYLGGGASPALPMPGAYRLFTGGAIGNMVAWDNFSLSASCYPDCNSSGSLTVADFGCFQGKYVLGDLYADCNASGALTVADFGCFQGKYVLGCP